MTSIRFWLSCGVLLAAAGMEAAGGTLADLAARRAQVLEHIDSSSAVVLISPEMAMRNGDVNYPFRQESSLLYLCGLNRPQVAMILVPSGIAVDGATARVLLFARESEEGGEQPLAIPDGVILPPGRFQETLSALLPRISILYVSRPGPAFVQDWLNGKPMFLERDSKKALEEKYPQLKVRSAGQVISGLRQCKSPAEVELIRRSIAVTGEGLKRAMEFCRPGVREYELQAEIEYPMIARGGGTSFPSIIGSGPNSLIPHYDLNRRATLAGDLVVLDVGAEFDGYAADVTRTIPVSGKFTPVQKKVYETVLRAQQAAIAAIVPGAPWRVLDSCARGVINAAGYGRFWLHSVSHHLGMDVHDVGAMDTLRAGMVITVEPGIYIPATDTTVAAEFRGFGIRIEDDVLVTSTGAEVLSSAIVKDADEIERAMSRKQR